MGRSSFKRIRRPKKKDLKPRGTESQKPAEKFTSIFSSKHDFYSPSEPQFFPPEAFGSGLNMVEPSQLQGMDIQGMSAWDIATRYHEFKSQHSTDKLRKHLRKLSAASVLERAQEVLGSVVHPVEPRISTLADLPPNADQADLDLEETLENSPLAVMGKLALTEQDIWMAYQVHRRQPIILSVDTSLSMTGEKLALTAVALTVVLLEFPDDPIGIVAFENEARILKAPSEKLSVHLLVERFLDVPAQGYTHLEEGMKVALRQVQNAQSGGYGRPPSTVLLTDGKYTAGRDPAYLAPRFPHLVVVKMGKERASLELCRELAKKGRGALREVDDLEALPTVMYGVVKDLLRGKSLA